MLRNKYLTASLLAALVSVGIWGCADVPTDMNLRVTQTVADNPVTVFGKVIDAQTRQGVGGAKVYIKVNGVWQSTTTSTSTSVTGDTGGSGDSMTGDYKFIGLPVSTTMARIIKSPTTGGYLQVTDNFTTPNYNGNSQGVNSEISQDLGNTEMETGIVATIYVVDSNTGSYVTKSDSSALPIYIGMGGNGSVEDVVATQDTTDTNKYTITIPQTLQGGLNGTTLTLTVPSLDINADGIYDYQTGTTTIATALPNTTVIVSSQANLTTTIAIAPITNSTALALVTDNIKNIDATSTGGTAMNFIGTSDPVKLLFNMPVALPSTTTDSVTMTYTDNFISLTATAVTAEVSVTAALSSGDTLLTVTPSAALTEGQTYTLNGTVTSTKSTTTDSVYNLATTTVTVTQTSAGTIGSSSSVIVDNFNYWTNGTVLTATDPILQANGQAFLVFPEPVWGTVRLISSTNGATTTISNGTPVVLTGQAVTYVIKALSTDAFNTHGGNVSGAIYIFDMTAAGMVGTVADDITATPRSLTLGIDAYDADGNTLITEASYAVQ